VNLVLNPTNVEAESAEAAAYHWTTRTHDLIASAWPGFNGLILLPANVNRPTPCSSSWDGTSINFGRAGNGCNNTAYLDVVAHEYGHAFHDWFHGSVNPAGFSEGIGDHLAFFVTGSREVGRSFFTNGSALRDYRPGGAANLTQWPCAGCPSARAGEVWAGFTMDLLDRLVASLGPAGGRAVWTAITIPMYAANPSDEVDALIEVYLLDDNDADLSNGTPHCADLTAAANRHSIPVPWGLPSTCGVPPLPVAPEYRAPVPVVELSGANYDSDPCLGGGERTIWWVSDRPGGRGGTDVWTASRPDLTSPWGEPVNVTEVNSPSNELGVEVGPNELEMFVVSNRPGGEGGYDLWYSTRPRTRDPWSTPVPVPFLNTSANELDPSFRGDGLELFFAADVGQPNLYFVYSTTRTHLGAPWDFLRTVLATNLSMGGPSISPDGKTLSVSVLENSDWKYRRYQRRGEVFGFTFWRFLDEINTPGQSVGDLDADEPGSGFSFWYSRVSDFGGAELWRADRILPLLGGPRSAAATESTTFTLRRDPGDYGFIVIALDALPATPIVGVTGPLLIVPLLTVAQGVHDTAGLVRWPTTIANAPGVIVHLQGLTQDPQGRLYLSNRHSFLHLP
jgi:hypothetical protein